MIPILLLIKIYNIYFYFNWEVFMFAENFGQAMNKSSQPLKSIKSQLKMSFDAIELRDTNPEKQFV